MCRYALFSQAQSHMSHQLKPICWSYLGKCSFRLNEISYTEWRYVTSWHTSFYYLCIFLYSQWYVWMSEKNFLVVFMAAKLWNYMPPQQLLLSIIMFICLQRCESTSQTCKIQILNVMTHLLNCIVPSFKFKYYKLLPLICRWLLICLYTCAELPNNIHIINDQSWSRYDRCSSIKLFWYNVKLISSGQFTSENQSITWLHNYMFVCIQSHTCIIESNMLVCIRMIRVSVKSLAKWKWFLLQNMVDLKERFNAINA